MSGIIGVESYGTMPGYGGGVLSGRDETRRMVQHRALSLLKQDVSHAAKIREHLTYQARLEGVLQLASRVIVDGDETERRDVAGQIQAVLAMGNDAA